jgi:hypothetical protein
MVAAGIGLILFIIFALVVLVGLAFFIAGSILMIIAAPNRKTSRGKFTLAIVFLSVGTLILSFCALVCVYISKSFDK